MRARRSGFTLLELMVSTAIIAVLLSILVPVLVQARREAARTICMNNVRQIGIGWVSYLSDQSMFPGAEVEPQWRYAGVRFLGGSVDRPIADERRPLTEYLHVVDENSLAGTNAASLYRCPEDSGLATMSRGGRVGVSVINGQSCYGAFGNSYRANAMLLDASLLGESFESRPLREAEVVAPPARLVLFGDPVWYYLTQAEAEVNGEPLDAAWHGRHDNGHVATLDGSVHYASFQGRDLGPFTVQPR